MVDIIIPAYNAEKTLPYALASIMTQINTRDLMVTIVDDCSDRDLRKNQTIAGFSEHLNLRILRIPRNGGPGVARQYGIDKTCNPYIMFVDADDILINVSAAKQLLHRLEENPKASMVAARFYEEREDGKVIEHGRDLVWMFSKMYRRSFLEEKGIRFNETRANEDTGFHTKILALAKDDEKPVFVDDYYYLWKFKRDSITRVNNAAYGYSNGFVGLIDNKIDALTMPGANKDFVKEQVLLTMFQAYKTYCEAVELRHEFVETIWNATIKFWRALGHKHKYSPTMDKPTLLRGMNSPWLTVPGITFYSFMNMVVSEKRE